MVVTGGLETGAGRPGGGCDQLKSSKVPIGVSEFELEKYIPKEMLEKLPTKEDLNLHLD